MEDVPVCDERRGSKDLPFHAMREHCLNRRGEAARNGKYS